jgi:hypothetical protein
LTGSSDEDISEEARLLAERVRERAAEMPSAADLAGIAADALTSNGSAMTPEEIRKLAAEALTKAQQVSFLLGKLAGLLDEPGDQP